MTIVKEELADKEHIIEVMESCIEDYKQMVTSMKSKLEAQ